MPVLDDFGFAVGDGGIHAIVGPNGSGKSTAIKGIAGAVSLDGGDIYIFGRRSDPSTSVHWRMVYAVLDDFPWLPDLTVEDHLMLMVPDRRWTVVGDALMAFGVPDIGQRVPGSLSAGQRQRAALATIRLRPWVVLLLDEPEKHLDLKGLDSLSSELRALAQPGRCIVLATHSERLLGSLECEFTRSSILGDE